jgi:cytochrome c5
MTMDALIERARAAASQVAEDVESVSHVDTLPTGVHVFEATCRDSAGKIIVSLNPNGLGAGVEWRHKIRGEGYRVFKIQGLVVDKPAQSADLPQPPRSQTNPVLVLTNPEASP